MRAGVPLFPELWAARVGALLWPASEPVREMWLVDNESQVIRVLKQAGKPLTNGQLAEAIGCSQGQATKLRRKVKHRLIEWRQGKYVFVTLSDFHCLPTVYARKLNGKRRKS